MSNLSILLHTALVAMFVSNLPLVRMLGVCPLASTFSFRNAWIYSAVAAFVLTVSGTAAWLIDALILAPAGLEVAQLLVFMMTAATLVQICETTFERFYPRMFHAIGTDLSLLAANCAVAGLMLTVTDTNSVTGSPFSLVEAAVHSIFAAAGMSLAILITSGLRERIDLNRLPKPFAGLAGAFMIAAIAAIVFAGFAGSPALH